MRVRVISLGQSGLLLEEADSHGQALVEIGVLRLRLPVEDLRPEVEGTAAKAAKPRKKATWSANALASAQTIHPELDLRGLMSAEAIEELDKYLDDALLAGLHDVRIIHGKGTGSLRRAVAEYLSSHPGIANFRLGVHGEGGDGVTIATLADGA